MIFAYEGEANIKIVPWKLTQSVLFCNVWLYMSLSGIQIIKIVAMETQESVLSRILKLNVSQSGTQRALGSSCEVADTFVRF